MRRVRTHVKFLVESIGDRVIAASSRFGAGRRTPAGHVLLAGPGGGSVGDEAMWRAFVRESPRPVTIVVRRPEDLLSAPDEPGVSVLSLPDLLYGKVPRHWRDVRTLLRLARRSRSVSVIGADTMEGVYNETSAVRRFHVAHRAAELGAEAAVLGFSWNARPGRFARRAMRSCAGDVALFARDGESAGRLRRDGGRAVRDVADLAFLTQPDAQVPPGDLRTWLSAAADAQRDVVIVNANPHLSARFPGQSDQYARLISDLITRGYSVVLLPHDSRGGEGGEEAYVAALHAPHVDSPFVHLVADVLMPEQVVALARAATFVVAGRMHLVILSSVAGTPSLALEYQDKFAGLYSLFGYEGSLRAPGEAEWDLAASVSDALDRREESASRLRRNQDRILSLARLNLPTS